MFEDEAESTNYDNLIWNKPSLPNKVDQNEDLILIVREDIILLVFKLLLSGLVFFIFLFARIFVLGLAPQFVISLFDALMFGIFAIIILQEAIFIHNYILSFQIISNKRVIDIDQKGLFNREENTLPFSNIEDINFKFNGFWGTVFNFGNVIIQSAGSGSGSNMPNAEDIVNGFTFNNIPDPKGVADTLSRIFNINQNEETKRSAMMNAEELKKILKPQ